MLHKITNYNWLMKLSGFDTNLTIPIVGVESQGLTIYDLNIVKKSVQSLIKNKSKILPELDWLDDPYIDNLFNRKVGDQINVNEFNNVLQRLMTYSRWKNKDVYIALSNISTKLLKVTTQKFIDKQQKTIQNKKIGKVTYFNILNRVTNYISYGLLWEPFNAKIMELLEQIFTDRMSGQGGIYVFINLTLEEINTIDEIFTNAGYNTNLIKQFLLSADQTSKKIFRFQTELRINVLPESSEFHIMIPLDVNFPSGFTSGPGFDFMQIVEPFFVKLSTPHIPELEYESARAREIDPTSYFFINPNKTKMLIKASYRVYENLKQLLAIKGFDISELNSAINFTLPKRSDFKRSKTIPGQLTGYFIIAKSDEPFQYAQQLLKLGIGNNISKINMLDPEEIKKYYSSIVSEAKKIVGGHPKDKPWFSEEISLKNLSELFPDLLNQRDQLKQLWTTIKELISGYVNALRNTSQKVVSGKRQAFDGTFWWDMLQYDIKKPGLLPFKIEPLQGKDIMWMYMNPSAILGDQTGAGKTVQAIIAADLRTKKIGSHPLLLANADNEKQYPEYIKVDQNGKKIQESEDPIYKLINNGKFVESSSNHKKAFDPQTQRFYVPTPEKPGEAIGNGKIIIFTVNNVVNQFAEEITYTTGASPDIIATSIPDMIKKGITNVKWLVLPYSTLNKNTPDQQIKENELGDEEDPESFDNMIANFNGNNRVQVVTRNLQFLKSIDFDVMILDECHRVKNANSATARNILSLGLSIPYKWGLTATYAANRPDDLKHQALILGHPIGQYKFQFEGLAGSRDVTHPKYFLNILRGQEPDFENLGLQEKIDFAIEYAETMPIDEEGKTLRQRSDDQIDKVIYANALIILTDFYHRKTKKDIKPNLPPHKISTEYIDPNLGYGDTIEYETNRLYENKTLEKQRRGQPPPPDIFPFKRQAIAIAKVPKTVELAKSILKQGKKVMIFSAYIASAHLIYKDLKEYLKPTGQKVYITTGKSNGNLENTEEIQTRYQQILSFRNNPNAKVYIFMIQSSGSGMDMPDIVEDVIINDYTYVPADLDQVEGRADRCSRVKPLTTHYVIIDDSLDKTIYLTVQKKRDLANKAQDIDQKYAEKLRTNQPVNQELEEAKNNHWELVKANISAQIVHEDIEIKEEYNAPVALSKQIIRTANGFKFIYKNIIETADGFVYLYKN